MNTNVTPHGRPGGSLQTTVESGIPRKTMCRDFFTREGAHGPCPGLPPRSRSLPRAGRAVEEKNGMTAV